MLSYVSQFSPPPLSADVPALAHGAIHKIIRIPPKSLPRVLCHSMSFCSAVDPRNGSGQAASLAAGGSSSSSSSSSSGRSSSSSSSSIISSNDE